MAVWSWKRRGRLGTSVREVVSTREEVIPSHRVGAAGGKGVRRSVLNHRSSLGLRYAAQKCGRGKPKAGVATGEERPRAADGDLIRVGRGPDSGVAAFHRPPAAGNT